MRGRMDRLSDLRRGIEGGGRSRVSSGIRRMEELLLLQQFQGSVVALLLHDTWRICGCGPWAPVYSPAEPAGLLPRHHALPVLHDTPRRWNLRLLLSARARADAPRAGALG